MWGVRTKYVGSRVNDYDNCIWIVETFYKFPFTINDDSFNKWQRHFPHQTCTNFRGVRTKYVGSRVNDYDYCIWIVETFYRFPFTINDDSFNKWQRHFPHQTCIHLTASFVHSFDCTLGMTNSLSSTTSSTTCLW